MMLRRACALVFIAMSASAASAAPPSAPAALPQVIERVDPLYPRMAMCENEGGTARVQANVDGEGRVTMAWVAVSSRRRDLDRAAVTAVRKWKFSATGTDSSGTIDIDFKPTGEASDCMDFIIRGGIVGRTAGYEAGTLEVRINHFPKDMKAVDLELSEFQKDGTVQRINGVRPGKDGRWVGHFRDLVPGSYALRLVAAKETVGHATFIVNLDRDVLPPPPAPPSR